MFKNNYKSQMMIPYFIFKDLEWWRYHIKIAKNEIIPARQFVLYIFSDVSNYA